AALVKRTDAAMLPIEIQRLALWDDREFRRYVRKATVVRLREGGRGPREFFNPRAALVFDRGALSPEHAAAMVEQSFERGVIGDGLRVAGPIRVDGARWGGLYLSAADPAREVRTYDPVRLLGDVAVIAALATVVSLAALYLFLARNVVRPLEDLGGVAAAFAAGDVSRRVRTLDRGDEIGRTLAAVNGMLELVQDYRANLERRVAEQLDVISRKNRELALAQRLAATGTLAAGVAHEINNPLAGMLNAVGRLKRAASDDARREKYLALLEENIERIGAIVRRLLDLSPRRAEAGPVDLGDLARSTLELVRFRAEKQGVALDLDVRPTPVVLGDRHELSQALLNLVINALDACPKGARVSVRVGEEDGAAALDVVDDGPGMSPDVQARAFDLFFTTKEAGKGTGLGLAAVHHAVTASGGAVRLESEPGRGTAVRIRLPAAGGLAR
ncbi:MAG TPA: ATP-binding protein, partial [Planctomycetota bacterium]|nr:ATP-binding protein [Planctomycetota bacterium]